MTGRNISTSSVELFRDENGFIREKASKRLFEGRIVVDHPLVMLGRPFPRCPHCGEALENYERF